MSKILIVEDDEKLRKELEIFLNKNGYQAVSLESFENPVKECLEKNSDLILLDINLPNIDGEYILREIRKVSNVPIIMITSKDNELDELMSLNYGADQYVTKPFNMKILRRRIEVALRRGKEKPSVPADRWSDGFLLLDFSSLTAVRGGEKLAITPNEYKLLKTLTENSGRILTRQLLLERLWDSGGNFIDDH